MEERIYIHHLLYNTHESVRPSNWKINNILGKYLYFLHINQYHIIDQTPPTKSNNTHITIFLTKIGTLKTARIRVVRNKCRSFLFKNE